MILKAPGDTISEPRHSLKWLTLATPRYAWLNNIVAVTKSRTGDGEPIHRVFAVA